MRTMVPEAYELDDTTKSLRKMRFLYITSFADMMVRFTDSNFPMPLQFTALSLLIRNKGSLTAKEMSSLMFRSKHSITKLVDILEKLGYVIRVKDKEDKRKTNIQITSSGLALVQGTMHSKNKTVMELMACLDKNEWKALIESLKKLRKGIIEQMKKK